MTDEPLVSALAYALARAQLPDRMETPRDYAERLAPLVIKSGYLTAIQHTETCGYEVNLTEVAYGNQYDPCRKPKGHDGNHDPSPDTLATMPSLDAERLARIAAAACEAAGDASMEQPEVPFWQRVGAELAERLAATPPDRPVPDTGASLDVEALTDEERQRQIDALSMQWSHLESQGDYVRRMIREMHRRLVLPPEHGADSIDAAIGYALNDCEQRVLAALYATNATNPTVLAAALTAIQPTEEKR